MLSDGFFMIKALPKDQAILDPSTLIFYIKIPILMQ